MRKNTRYYKKLFFISILFVMVLGYALISSNLDIVGTLNLKHANWNIHWDSNSVEVAEGSISSELPIVNSDEDEVSYTINLSNPGDFFEFTLDAVNDGDVDGMVGIDSLDPVITDGDGEEIELPNYLKYKVTYSDDKEIERYHYLKAGEIETIKVRIEFDKEVEKEDLPSEAIQLNITTNLPYRQADDNAYEREKGQNTYLITFNPNEGDVVPTSKTIRKGKHIGELPTPARYGYRFDGWYTDIATGTKITEETIPDSDTTYYAHWIADYAEFDIGDNVNKKIRRLSTVNSIKEFKKSNTPPDMSQMTDANVVSSENSMYPIYAWFDNETIYWWTDNQYTYLNVDGSDFFSDLPNLITIDTDSFNTGQTENMANFLYKSSSIRTLDVSKLDTKNVTNMSNMFNGTNIDNLDLSKLNTEKVTNMSAMFCGTNIDNYNISELNISNVRDMSGMFAGTNATHVDLSSWDISKVERFGDFFGGSTVQSVNLSGWNFASATNIGGLFGGCYHLSDINLENVNTSHVTSMNGLFSALQSLETINLTSFDVSNVTDFTNIFGGSSNLKHIDISGWNFASVTSLYRFFGYQGLTNLETVNMTGVNTSKITNMSQMFIGCSNLKQIDVSSFDTNNVTDISGMFQYCSSLKELDLSTFDTSKITNMGGIVGNCSALETLNLSNFDFRSCNSGTLMMGISSGGFSSLKTLILDSTIFPSNMNYGFGGLSSVEELSLENVNTSNVIDMSSMFQSCNRLTEINLSSFSIEKVANSSYMFSGCNNLETIYATLDFSNVSSSNSMFSGCTKLIGGQGTVWNNEHIDKSYAHVDGGTSNPGYFSIKKDITIKFDPNDGSLPQYAKTKELNTGEVIGMLPIPERRGYTFLGWYTAITDGIKITEETIPTGDTTYYAHWELASKYIITFDPNGGSVTPASKEIDVGSSLGELPTPERTNYIFLGWYTEETGGTEVNSDTITDGDTIYYAHWRDERIYIIEFDPNGGNVTPNSKNVIKETVIGELPTPTRDNHQFEGWYTAITDGTRITEETIPTSDAKYYAHWTDLCIPFVTDSWETIAGNNPSVYPVGCTREINLGTLGTHTLRVTNNTMPSECLNEGFSQSACGLVIEFANVINTHRMNPYSSSPSRGYGNVGGWEYSEMRHYINNDIYNSLPTDLKNKILDTKVVSGHGSTESTNFTTIDKLYLPSTKEVWGKEGSSFVVTNDTAEAETRQLDYYKEKGVTTNSGTYSPAIKKTLNGTNNNWWLRSARSNSNVNFYNVNTTGIWGSNTSTGTYGVSPAFRLGEKYTVTLNPNGGSVDPTSIEVIEGNTVGELPTPTRSNYTFDGWHIDLSDYTNIDSSYIPSEDITLYAKWYPTGKVAEINGTFYNTLQTAVSAVPTTDEETTVRLLTDVSETITINSGRNVVLNLQNYTLSNNGVNNVIKNNAKLKLYNGTITTDTTQGAINNNSGATLVVSGGRIIANGTRQGIYNDGGTLTITGDAYISAAATERSAVHNKNSGKVTITGGTIVSNNLYAIYNENGTLTIGEKDGIIDTITPVIQGKTYGIAANNTYKFYDGIIKGGTYHVGKTSNTGNTPTVTDDTNETKITEIEDNSEKILGTETIDNLEYKTLNLQPRKYLVTFNANGGTVTPSTKEVVQGRTIGELPIPTRENYAFDGWYTELTGGEKVEESYIPTGDKIIYARWHATKYVITFNANSGSVSPSSKTIEIGSSIGSLPTPTRENYAFDGWYTELTGGERVEESYIPTGDKIIYARWHRTQYVISFDSNEGEVTPTSKIIIAGNSLGELPIPTKQFYNFEGWYTDISSGLQVTSDTVPEDDDTYYAHWTKEPTYTISFNAGEGSPVADIKIVQGKPIGSLPTSEKYGYIVEGWYTSTSYTTKITADTIPTGDTTYYAHWKEATATFDIGENVNFKFKKLAGDNPISSATDDTKVKSIQRSLTEPIDTNKTTAHLVSSVDSELPIYAWYSNETIYWWAGTDDVYLNENSRYLYYKFMSATYIDTTSFDTSNVTDMLMMFGDCKKITNIDLSTFNTSKVIYIGDMFYNCEKLISLDLSSFDTTHVTSMGGMFCQCYALTSLNLGNNFNTSKVTYMGSMFMNCSSLTSIDFGSKFNTSNVTNMSNMFCGCHSLISLDLSKFNTNKVTRMNSMFFNCEVLTNLDLSSFDTTHVTDMESMFIQCYALTTLNLGNNFDTSRVMYMNSMFMSCMNLTSLNLGNNFDTGKVLNMSKMFYQCYALTTLNLGNKFDTSNVTNMSSMFSNCRSLTSLNLGNNFDTSNVTNMSGMFSDCRSLTSLNLGNNFDTSNVTNMSGMFSECNSLTILEFKNDFNTEKVTNMSNMFKNCSNLETIYVTNSFVTTKVTSSSNMFSGDTKLIGGWGTIYNANYIDKTYAIIDTTNTPGYFTIKDGWVLMNRGSIGNPGDHLLEQQWSYYTNGVRNESGFYMIDDLYGTPQKYYFVNGIAQLGWVHVGDYYYYFRTDDDDDGQGHGNGYVNACAYRSLTPGTTITVIIDDESYSFDTEGRCTNYNSRELFNTVGLSANGGEVSTNIINVNANSNIGELPTPTREGYTFAGWYTGLTEGTLVEKTYIPTTDTMLYARWVKVN